ncbi:serine/threonine-protein kinase [Actinoplanes sp. NPDC051851]|uniref:serine/threonine-protein kinase n=1 Tax=Actinoplanes sp. NPDC051851 TaxID=3154753 RepID=UPI0034373816
MQDIETIGRYRIVRPLGEGAFATVFLAIDEELESQVAIKVLAPKWNLDAGVRERFLDEARLLRRLAGERLVRVHDIGQLADGRPYFVMEYADRATLRARLDHLSETGQTVPFPAAVAVARQVALALVEVHEAGVVHRDIKPENILLRTGGPATRDTTAEPVLWSGERLVLGDFGLAKDLTRALTGHSLAVGTPGYMAPEQAAATAVSQAADVYACSALLFRMLVGFPPAADSAGVLADSAAGPAVQDVIRSGLDPAPAARQPTARRWLRCLDEALARDTGGRPRRRLRPALLAAVAGLGVLGGAGGWLATRPAQDRPAAPVAYEKIFDDSRKLSLEVPGTWTQHLGNGWHPDQDPYYREQGVGPGLNASPNVNDWFSSAAVPGMFAGVSSRVVSEAGFTPELLERGFGPSGCTRESRGAATLPRLGLTGLEGSWICGAGVRWRYAYLWPADHRYLMVLEIKEVSAADATAWQHIRDTVTVHGTL